VAGLTEAEREMDGRFGTRVAGHVEVHGLEGRQLLPILQQEFADSSPGSVKQAPARQTV
jgi:hypothetical protein